MLVDPPLRYHLPQSGWVRFDRAIDEIQEARQEFVDWLEYGVQLIDPSYSILDLDSIDIQAGPLNLTVDGMGLRSAPPPPDSPHLPLFRAIEGCVSKARRLALELLYCELIFEGRFRVYARKHEPDADLQLMPDSVWAATHGAREPRVCTAHLTTGKAYFDVHFERVEPSEASNANAVCNGDEIEPRVDVNVKIGRLIGVMTDRVPHKVTYAEAKELLGYEAYKRKKEIDLIWARASERMNAMKEQGQINFPGQYRKPGGNPKHAKLKG